MVSKIVLGNKKHIRECINSVKSSELWDKYIQKDKYAEEFFKEGFKLKEIYVALNKNGNCIGYLWIRKKGCFRKFSYLVNVAVKRRYRNKGIGAQLIRKFEEIGFKEADRVFILVSDFNKNAFRFYKKLGYKKVGNIKGLFRSDISEYLLIKYKK